jgi:hypothetical protein
MAIARPPPLPTQALRPRDKTSVVRCGAKRDRARARPTPHPVMRLLTHRVDKEPKHPQDRAFQPGPFEPFGPSHTTFVASRFRACGCECGKVNRSVASGGVKSVRPTASRTPSSRPLLYLCISNRHRRQPRR